MAFDFYLRQVRTSLDTPAALNPELTEELRDHLEDAAHDLQLTGMQRAESEQEAMRRFGAPEVVAEAFRRAERRRSPGALLHHPRSWLAVAALATALLGGAAATAAHTQHPIPAVTTHMAPSR